MAENGRAMLAIRARASFLEAEDCKFLILVAELLQCLLSRDPPQSNLMGGYLES